MLLWQKLQTTDRVSLLDIRVVNYSIHVGLLDTGSLTGKLLRPRAVATGNAQYAVQSTVCVLITVSTAVE